jgi:hypothetical protein
MSARGSSPSADRPVTVGHVADGAVSTSTPSAVHSTVSSLRTPVIDAFHANAWFALASVRLVGTGTASRLA